MPMRPPFVLILAGCLALAAAAAGPSLAFETSGARLHALDRELAGVAPRTRLAPRDAGFALDRARRELRRLEVEAPRDPEAMRLRREIGHLQIQADRASRKRTLDASVRRLDTIRDGLAVPGYLRSPVDVDLRGPRPIGAGKLFIFIQNALRGAEGHLSRGRIGPAATALAEAERALARLSAGAAEGDDAIPPDDPNLLAARSQIATLRERLNGLENGAGEG